MIYFKAVYLFFKSSHKTSLKFKTLYWFIHYRAWLKALDQRLSAANVGYITKTHPFVYYMCRLRSYVIKGSSKEFILDRVAGHYETLGKHFSEQEVKQIFSEQGLSLGNIQRDESDISLSLQYIHRMRNEGQLSLRLMVDGEFVYYAHFHFYDNAIWVGGVQGGNGNLDVNKTFTKITHGLRPQNYIFLGLTALAQRCEFDTIYGINSEYHYYQHESHFANKVAFNYNRFWEELGGELHDAEAWFKMTSDYPRRDLEDIASKKRSQYRKRYELIDEVVSNAA